MTAISLKLEREGLLRISLTEPGHRAGFGVAERRGPVEAPTSWTVSDWTQWLGGDLTQDEVELRLHSVYPPESSYAWADAVLALVRLLEAVRVLEARVDVEHESSPRGAWVDRPALELAEASEHLVSWIIERFEQYDVDVVWRSD